MQTKDRKRINLIFFGETGSYAEKVFNQVSAVEVYKSKFDIYKSDPECGNKLKASPISVFHVFSQQPVKFPNQLNEAKS